MRKLLAGVAIGAFLKSSLAVAANIPLLSGAATADPSQMQATINQVIQTINSSVGVGGFSFGRNLLDNGDMWVNQRNATATCSLNGTPSVLLSIQAYGPDRWMCNVDMALGAGQLAVATSSPTPPQGFVNEATLVRNSGSLGAYPCAWQEVNTQRATAMQGQNVVFSVDVQGLAGLTADNGNTAFLAVVTGTTAGGADGLGGLRSAVGWATPIKASSATISTSTGVITNGSTVAAGAPIYFGAATAPGGITLGQTYYVSSNLLNTGTSFTVAPTYAQAIAGTGTVIPSSAGTTVTISLPKIAPVWGGFQMFSSVTPSGAASPTGTGAAVSASTTLPAATWVRMSTGPLLMPANITEAAVAVCFAPNSATSGGATDGIAFTGAQLEILGPNMTNATTYEFKSPQQEWMDALRYYLQLNDQASGTPIGPIGTLLTNTTCGFAYQFPEVMDIAPVYESVGTITTTTFQIYVAADTSTLTSAGITASSLTTTNSAGFTATLTTSSTAGWACELMGQTAQAKGLSWSADF